MRGTLAVASLLTLGACGDPNAVYRPPPEVIAAYEAQMGPPTPPSAADLEYRERERQAAAICAARADMAGATYGGRGFGLTGALTAGLEAGVAAERVRTSCMNAYMASGVMPGL